ncbi:hypothetical protein BC628DRAFT_1417770 [Trametes gibbosa]|nr:hypothetical protein BC628DRAFT_1421828 [Trametes gibbosa]KAI0828182.1 hypothetical protein BC628DRAFT_1417770 [Trametes gibbosa]
MPIDPATNEPFLRFRWDKDGKDASNIDSIQKVVLGVRTLGPALYPTSTVFLPAILDAHIKNRVFKKYKYLHGEWTRENKVDEDNDEGLGGDGAEGEGDNIFGDADNAVPDIGDGRKDKTTVKLRNKRATHNSRASATLTIRKRKRATHPEYSKPKYDTAFILNAMSAEEDKPDVLPGAVKRYIIRSPGYQSDLAKQVRREVDALPDPDPEKSGRMFQWVRGDEIVDAIPPKAKNLTTRIHAWQVKPELLEKNPGWLTSGRVAANGRLWGKEEDPVDEEPKSAKRREGPSGTVDVVALKRKRRQSWEGGMSLR